MCWSGPDRLPSWVCQRFVFPSAASRPIPIKFLQLFITRMIKHKHVCVSSRPTDKSVVERCPACFAAACNPEMRPAINTLADGRVFFAPSLLFWAVAFFSVRCPALTWVRAAVNTFPRAAHRGAVPAASTLPLHRALLVPATRKIPG